MTFLVEAKVERQEGKKKKKTEERGGGKERTKYKETGRKAGGWGPFYTWAKYSDRKCGVPERLVSQWAVDRVSQHPSAPTHSRRVGQAFGPGPTQGA